MLLQQMMDAGRLIEFISEVGNIMYEEKLHDMRWDYWLHRVFDITFDEYMQSLEQDDQPETSDVEATVKHSYDMMENFHPE